MACAIAGGLVAAQLVAPGDIMAAGPGKASLQQFVDRVPGSQTTHNNVEAALFADVCFISVKPFNVGKETSLGTLSFQILQKLCSEKFNRTFDPMLLLFPSLQASRFQ